MKQNKNRQAFTLLEILTVISLIALLTLGVSNLNFQRLSDTQRLSIESFKIRTLLEDTRNNALIGRADDGSGTIREYWEVEIDSVNNTLSGSTFGSTQITKPYAIQALNCKRIDQTNTGTGTIVNLRFYSGSGTTLNGCPTNSKILDILLGRGMSSKTIRVNTVTQTIDEL